VDFVFVRSSERWLVAGGLCLILTGTTLSSEPRQAPQRPGQLPMLPLTQLDEHAAAADLDNHTLTLTFGQPVPIGDLLLLLVRGTSLSVVPDPTISGVFIGDLKNVTVRQALALILEPMGLDYTADGTFVRVFRRDRETRIFDLNYSATDRTGAAAITGGGASGSTAGVSSLTRGDVFADLTKGVQALVSEHATFSVDRKAGLLQVTDVPERLDRIAIYLDAVQDRVHRQAQIEARVVEVELNDEKAIGIDWTAIAAQLVAGLPAGQPASRPLPTGLRVQDAAKLLELLAAQGKVTTIASPRLMTLNNETAVVRTDAVTFSMTPQIAADGEVTLSLSPIVKAPAVAESDMIARVNDGETLVISGFTRDYDARERKNVGLSGGWFGRATVIVHKRIELVILLTPRIMPAVLAP
jgi:type II secretory pathway component HofQ